MKINEMHESHFTHMAQYSQLTFILTYTLGKNLLNIFVPKAYDDSEKQHFLMKGNEYDNNGVFETAAVSRNVLFLVFSLSSRRFMMAPVRKLEFD